MRFQTFHFSLLTLRGRAIACAAISAQLLVASAMAQVPSKHDNPGSLWTADAKDTLADHRAKSVGDLLTIILNESFSSSFSANTKASKNDSTSILKGVGPILGNIIPNLSLGANSSNAGSGTTSQNGILTGQMTVIVKQILPNGVLLVEGTRTLRTNKDTQNLKLTGMVRPEDIQFNNTVLSSNVANEEFLCDGKGMISDRQRKGILTRLLDWLF